MRITRILDHLKFMRTHPYSIHTQMLACGHAGTYSKIEIEFAKDVIRRKWGMKHHAFKKDIKAYQKRLKAYNRV